MILKIV